jgi:predicted transcriptional regulator YdeE
MVYLNAFSVIGAKKFASKVDGANFTNIPQMWADFPVDDLNRLRELSDLEPSGHCGIDLQSTVRQSPQGLMSLTEFTPS